MKRRDFVRTTAMVALLLSAGPVPAQDVLPFASTPMGGKVGPSM